MKHIIDKIRKIRNDYYEQEYNRVIQTLVRLSDEEIKILFELISDEYKWRFENVRCRTKSINTIN